MKATRMGRIRNIHFIGIGGAGMAGIAEVLVNLGYSVSGTDLKLTGVTERLRSLGARFEGSVRFEGSMAFGGRARFGRSRLFAGRRTTCFREGRAAHRGERRNAQTSRSRRWRGCRRCRWRWIRGSRFAVIVAGAVRFLVEDRRRPTGVRGTTLRIVEFGDGAPTAL